MRYIFDVSKMSKIIMIERKRKPVRVNLRINNWQLAIGNWLKAL